MVEIRQAFRVSLTLSKKEVSVCHGV